MNNALVSSPVRLPTGESLPKRMRQEDVTSPYDSVTSTGPSDPRSRKNSFTSSTSTTTEDQTDLTKSQDSIPQYLPSPVHPSEAGVNSTRLCNQFRFTVRLSNNCLNKFNNH